MKRIVWIGLVCIAFQSMAQRNTLDFTGGWKFLLGNDSLAIQPVYNDQHWRTLNLPHDWSIEQNFDEKAPATNQGAALPAGIGWYRKTFSLPAGFQNKQVSIEFDGIYRNSEVWINGHYLGKRPNGYISFSYLLTPFLKFGSEKNTITVKADNSQQPNSRWYSGSGIYRNVRLVVVMPVHINHTNLFVSTPEVSTQKAIVQVAADIINTANTNETLQWVSVIRDASGKEMARKITSVMAKKETTKASIALQVNDPRLWSVSHPYLYTVVNTLLKSGKIIDEVSTPIGIRSFRFDADKGFFLNGEPVKIKGVCMHHDLGALGAAVNQSAIRRQLRILQEMGCNAIRTAHNPPAPELLDLCDQMGFLVMDEAFDMWKKKKNKFDYYADFPEWHQRDLEAQVLRDRNHPSVILWSIGNEIREQFDSTGITLTRELVNRVKAFDTTRPVTAALSEWNPEKNFMYQSGALDVIGLNYHQEMYGELPKYYPGQKLVAAETMSALASRGHYDMPSDSLMFWPQKSPMKYVDGGNKDLTVSAYDQVAAYWGSTHEQTWKLVKKYDYLSGLFVWSGFDFLGEPVPYPWPARSSYYGIIDMAGFPKDTYYMYQSEWTNKPVLHILPHWNWEKGKKIDVWAYYSQADEVELYLNGRSLGVKRKENDNLHVQWRVDFEPGVLKAVSRKNGKIILEKETRTAGKPFKIELVTDKKIVHHKSSEISFVTVRILDKEGNIVPDASDRLQFSVEGNGRIEGVDNGNQTNLLPFKASYSRAYNGLCLVMLSSAQNAGKITLTAKSEGLLPASVSVKVL